jgi:predicted ATPase
MELILKNILKVVDATIKVDGITVIAGSNNMGKSTAGKALLTAISAFADMDQFIEKQRILNLRKELVKLGDALDLFCKKNTNIVRKKTGKINSTIDLYIPRILEEESGEAVQKDIDLFIRDICGLYGLNIDYINSESFDAAMLAYSNIMESFELDDDEIGYRHVTDEFRKTFGDSVVNFNASAGSIIVEENGTAAGLTFTRDKKDYCSEIIREYPMKYNALSVGEPDVLNLFGSLAASRAVKFSKKKLLRGLLQMDRYKSLWEAYEEDGPDKSIIDEINLERKFSQALEKVQQVLNGYVVYDSNGLNFVENGLEGKIPVENMSTGLKSMVLLEQVIKLGLLTDNTVWGLDEPEIHLHPEWQIRYAEIIVLLQKYVGLKVVIATHSPYFLKAILYFSRKYEVIQNANFYTTVNTNGGVCFEDVTNKVDSVFKQLTVPLFEIMEDTEFNDL